LGQWHPGAADAPALRVEVAAEAAWDPRVVCRALVRGIATHQPTPDLVLLGREFRDRDDGIVPPLLAVHLGWRFFGLSHRAVRGVWNVVLLRESGAFGEHAAFTPPVGASVTNHPESVDHEEHRGRAGSRASEGRGGLAAGRTRS
jgi:hypothetical protein